MGSTEREDPRRVLQERLQQVPQLAGAVRTSVGRWWEEAVKARIGNNAVAREHGSGPLHSLGSFFRSLAVNVKKHEARFGREVSGLQRRWEEAVRFHGRPGSGHRPLLASLSASFGGSSVENPAVPEPAAAFTLAMTIEQVSKRLDGVPVYTVSNASSEFVLISDLNSQKSLGIFCFRHEDAEALLMQVKDREPGLGRGARVVAVSLDKVYQLNAEGIAFRFLPDPLQVKNALEARTKAGDPGRAFDGVPVFQSDNLILRSNNHRFCPIFFCKEDLERALRKAFKAQQRINPSMRVNTEIQVGSFEDVLKRMESSEEDSGWGDIVFIPPGMDAMNHLGRAVAAKNQGGALANGSSTKGGKDGKGSTVLC